MVRHAGEIKYNLIKNYIQSERDKVLSDIQKCYETLGEKTLKVLEIEKKLKSFST
jgi:hypothetical protein